MALLTLLRKVFPNKAQEDSMGFGMGPCRSIPYLAGLLLERGIAEMTERNSAFTALDDLKTAATSGSSTTVTASADIFEAKRLGFDLL